MSWEDYYNEHYDNDLLGGCIALILVIVGIVILVKVFLGGV